MLRKRKNPDVSDPELASAHLSLLEGQLKRVKIAFTPGELRLQKDVIAVQRVFPMLNILPGVNSSSVVIVVPIGIMESVEFVVTVSKYYPHARPIVRCSQLGRFLSEYIMSSSGVVVHQTLNDWSAINSLIDVVNVLQFVCNSLMVNPS